jgi:hypothetical protein
MIVIISRENDKSTCDVMDWLMCAGQKVIRINAEDKINDIKIFTDENDNLNCTATFGEKQVDFSKIRSFCGCYLFRVWTFYKPIIKIFSVFIYFLFSLSVNAQSLPEDPLEIVHTLQFNYKAYLKLKQMDSIYANSSLKRRYDDIFSVLESRYGKYIEGVNRYTVYLPKSRWTLEHFPFIQLIPMSQCLDSLVSQHSVVMINEEHFNPVYRSIAHSFLEICYRHGYRYFAVETLNARDISLNKRKYPLLHETGFYNDEPLYGDLLRQALQMGYTLIPYDTFPPAGSISRDEQQALNIINQTVAKDSSAKILVFAGMGHIFDSQGFHTMGWYFKEHSSIDPLTINFLYFSPRYKKEEEGDAQRYFLDIADSLSIREPCFLYDTVHEKFRGIGTDFIAIIPRTIFIHNTIPSWKVFNGKVFYTIDKSTWEKYGMEQGLVSAFLLKEKKKSVPVDQIEFQKIDKEITLVLYKAKYRIQFDNGKNKKTMIVKIK